MSPDRKKRLLYDDNQFGMPAVYHTASCIEYLVENGFVPYSFGIPYRTDFFYDIKKIFSVSMPTEQDFCDYCEDKLSDKDSVLITFDEFYECISKGHKLFQSYFKQNTIRGYLLRGDFDTWKENRQIHSMRELLNVLWNDPRPYCSIASHSLFAIATENGKPMRDNAGNALLHFDGKIHTKEVIDYAAAGNLCE